MSEPLLITSRCDWTEQKIADVYVEIEKIAYEDLELEGMIQPNSFEVVSAEQMIDAYASIGLPVHYNHWSFGKDFLQTKKAYDEGKQGLAYELVINSIPTVNYLMEDNSMMMMALVAAHAGIGHNAFFKNNIAFKQWTNAGSIVDYMVYARDYIRRCEEKYGPEEVELVLDAAHALAPHGIDKYKRSHKPKLSEEVRLQKIIEEEDRLQREKDVILQKMAITDKDLIGADPATAEMPMIEDDDIEEEENLLYFIMKKSPSLANWKREILRIVYKVNQYFYPQGLTKNANEGFASFTHFFIMTRLEEKGILSPDGYLAFLQSHSGVLYQPEYDKRWYSGINPYTLGFNILMDVKRICENPTEEDKEWFPFLIGKRWQDAVKEAAFEHRDDSLIMQYLSPHVIRKMKLFSVNANYNCDRSDDDDEIYRVSEIHDEVGYKQIRNNLAKSFERINYVPQIAVVAADLEGDRTLYLEYVPYMGRELDRDSAESVANYIDFLWGHAVVLDDGHDDDDDNGNITYSVH